MKINTSILFCCLGLSCFAQQDTTSHKFRLGIGMTFFTTSPITNALSYELFVTYKVHNISVGPMFSQRLYNNAAKDVGIRAWGSLTRTYGFQMTGVNGISINYLITLSRKKKLINFMAASRFNYIEYEDGNDYSFAQLKLWDYTLLGGINFMNDKKFQVQLLIGAGITDSRKVFYIISYETSESKEKTLSLTARLSMWYVIWQR